MNGVVHRKIFALLVLRVELRQVVAEPKFAFGHCAYVGKTGKIDFINFGFILFVFTARGG